MTENTIAIIGLGYVGLPLAHAFAKKYKVVSLPINPTLLEDRIEPVCVNI
jgi:UDP-N-acetyl-D-galactosamine dehydrogenase